MISERIHATLVRWTLLICKSLLATAFLAVIISAAARYFLSTGSVKLDDIQHYSFGSLILLAIVVAFWSEKHVKIELVQSKRTSNAFQMIWAVLLVCIPMILIVTVSVPAVRLSWINSGRICGARRARRRISIEDPAPGLRLAVYLWCHSKDIFPAEQ